MSHAVNIIKDFGFYLDEENHSWVFDTICSVNNSEWRAFHEDHGITCITLNFDKYSISVREKIVSIGDLYGAMRECIIALRALTGKEESPNQAEIVKNE